MCCPITSAPKLIRRRCLKLMLILKFQAQTSGPFQEGVSHSTDPSTATDDERKYNTDLASVNLGYRLTTLCAVPRW